MSNPIVFKAEELEIVVIKCNIDNNNVLTTIYKRRNESSLEFIATYSQKYKIDNYHVCLRCGDSYKDDNNSCPYCEDDYEDIYIEDDLINTIYDALETDCEVTINGVLIV